MVATLAHSEALALVEQAELAASHPGCAKSALKNTEQAISRLSGQEEKHTEEVEMPAADARLLARALCHCGDLQLSLGNVVEAQSVYKRAKAIAPEDTRATAGFAATLAMSDKAKEAKEMLAAQEPQPGKNLSVGDSIYLGRAWLAAGEEDKGVALLKSAWSRGGDSYELGVAHLSKYLKLRSVVGAVESVDEYKQAMSSFKDSARLNRKDPRARYKIALLTEEMYRHKMLYLPLEMPAEDEPPVSVAVTMLGGAHGPLASAIAKVQDTTAKTAQAQAEGRAMTYAIQAEEQIQAIAMKHGVSDDPEVGEVLHALLGEVKRLEAAKKAARGEVVSALYHYKCRQACLEGAPVEAKFVKAHKSITAAAQEYEEVCAVAGASLPEVALHLARLHLFMGKRDQALKLARKAVEAEAEEPVGQVYLALLQQPGVPLPRGPDAAAFTCPAPLMAAADSVQLCVARMADVGPALHAHLLAEVLCHVSNTDLLAAAVAVALGHNAAGQYDKAEDILRKLATLIPAFLKDIPQSSVVALEIRGLYATVLEQLLRATQAKDPPGDAVEQAQHYDELYEVLCKDPDRRGPAVERLVSAARMGVAMRPQCSKYLIRLADALWTKASIGRRARPSLGRMAGPGSPRDKAAVLREVEEVLRGAIAHEGLPEWIPAAPPTPHPAEAAKKHPDPSATAARKGSFVKAVNLVAKANDGNKPTPRTSLDENGKSPAGPGGNSTPPSTRNSHDGKADARAKRGRSGVYAPGERVKEAASKKGGAALLHVVQKVAAGAGKALPSAKNNKRGSINQPKETAEARPTSPQIENNPKSVRARLHLARVLRRDAGMGAGPEEHQAECIRLYRHAVALDPRCVDAYIGLAHMHAEKDLQAALREMQAFPAAGGASKRDEAALHMAAAQLLLHMGERAEEREHQALLVGPQMETSLTAVADALGWNAIQEMVTVLEKSGTATVEMLKRVYMNTTMLKEKPHLATKYFRSRGWQ